MSQKRTAKFKVNYTSQFFIVILRLKTETHGVVDAW